MSEKAVADDITEIAKLLKIDVEDAWTEFEEMMRAKT
jgi:hypothetical protein